MTEDDIFGMLYYELDGINMRGIPRDAKIMSVSHNDLDGVGCQIVLGNVFKNIHFISSSYYNADDVLESIDYSRYDYVIVTDLSPNNPDLLDHPKIWLFDHHDTMLPFHDPEKNRFVIDSVCATKLTHAIMVRMYKESLDLSHLDEFVDLVNDYDLYKRKIPKSWELNEIMFYKYRAQKFRKAFKDGRTEFNDEELEFLEERRKKFEELYSNLELYDLPKIRACVIYKPECMNEVSERLNREEGYDIIIIRNTRGGRTSIRSFLEGFNAGEFASTVSENGGGHVGSAGWFSENEKHFKQQVKKLQDYIIENFPQAVKQDTSDD